MHRARANDDHAPQDAVRTTDTAGATQREWVWRGFTWLEDLVYIGLGLLIGGSALVLLVSGGSASDKPCSAAH